MINLNKQVLDAVSEDRIPKDDLIHALLRIIGPADLREILEACDWTMCLENGEDLPVYKSKAFNVDDIAWNNDMEDNEDD